MAAGDDDLLREAKDRFRRCEEYESLAREHFLFDCKFANGDADNGYQWPDALRRNRNVDDKPSLTLNLIRQHNLQIINDAKQNKPAVRMRPTGGDATTKSAEIFEGIVRHIEYISNAQVAYDTATEFQVTGGWGYWRVLTDYESDDSFDQEVYIKRVKDPTSIYMDPDAKEFDRSDAKYAFVFDDMARDAFDLKYPKYKDRYSNSMFDDGWVDQDHVRIAEYYRVNERPDKLLRLVDPESGEVTTVRAGELPAELRETVLADPETQQREVIEQEVEWYLIIGDAIAERKIWAGTTIPIVMVIGEETIIEGVLDRKGHTRAMIDPQRTYNYWCSSALENVALQTKVPYIAPAAAIEGYETYWRTANTVNHSVLPFNHISDEGVEIPPPQRIEPPTMAQAYIQGMQIAQNDIMGVSGQFQAQMGRPGNEKSGTAIAQRQRQGDTATYHYIDNLAIAIRRTGKILLELIPKIYDTPRVIKILAESGEQIEVHLDPQHPKALSEIKRQAQEGEEVKRIFNPGVGRYEVEADIGPAYATQRQEAWNAFVQIAGQSPQIMQIAGDLMFKAADFPMADELAERLRRTIPPGILGEGLPPPVQHLLQTAQQQAQMSQKMLAEMTQRATTAEAKSLGLEIRLKGKDELRDIDVYKADTERMKALADMLPVDPEGLRALVHQLVQESLGDNLGQVTAANASELSPADKYPQARRAPDGNLYVPDQARPGKYLMVAA